MRVSLILLGTTFAIAAAAVTPKAARQGPPPNATAKDSLRFVAHPDNVPAGFPSNDRPLALRNPYEGNAQALKTGSQLYVSYNCIDFMARTARAMGPSLADSRWHFGGTPPEVFESIYQGVRTGCRRGAAASRTIRSGCS
jgi:hypothetical protein